MRPIATLLFAAALAVTACTAAREGQPDAETQERFDSKDYPGARIEVDGGLAANAPVATAARQRIAAPARDATWFPRSSVSASMVIRTGQASIEVDSLEQAVAQVRLLAGRVGRTCAAARNVGAAASSGRRPSR